MKITKIKIKRYNIRHNQEASSHIQKYLHEWHELKNQKYLHEWQYIQRLYCGLFLTQFRSCLVITMHSVIDA